MGICETKECTRRQHIGEAKECQYPTCADVCEHCCKFSVVNPAKLLCRLCHLAEELELEGSGNKYPLDTETGKFQLVFSLAKNKKKNLDTDKEGDKAVKESTKVVKVMDS